MDPQLTAAEFPIPDLIVLVCDLREWQGPVPGKVEKVSQFSDNTVPEGPGVIASSIPPSL